MKRRPKSQWKSIFILTKMLVHVQCFPISWGNAKTDFIIKNMKNITMLCPLLKVRILRFSLYMKSFDEKLFFSKSERFSIFFSKSKIFQNCTHCHKREFRSCIIMHASQTFLKFGESWQRMHFAKFSILWISHTITVSKTADNFCTVFRCTFSK